MWPGQCYACLAVHPIKHCLTVRPPGRVGSPPSKPLPFPGPNTLPSRTPLLLSVKELPSRLWPLSLNSALSEETSTICDMDQVGPYWFSCLLQNKLAQNKRSPARGLNTACTFCRQNILST